MGVKVAGAPGMPQAPAQAHPPTLATPSVALAGQEQQRRAALAAGVGSDNTVATSNRGTVTPPSTAKTLLG